MIRRIILTTLLAAASLAAPAAAKPTQERFVTPYEFTVPCDGFDILVQGEAHLIITTWFDRSGEPVREVGHDRFTETDTNTVSGETVRFSGSRRDARDLVAGTRTVTGKSFLMTGEGRGLLVLDAGRNVFDAPFHVVFESGFHEVLHGDVDAISCAALA